MALYNINRLVLETEGVAESLPDPTLVLLRTHYLLNAGTATVTWSSVGATPFQENGVNVVTITVVPGNAKLIQSDGIRWIVHSLAPGFLLLPTVTAPVRALNSVFTPNVTRPVLGIYSVQIGGTTTLLSGDDGRIELRSNLGAPVTVRASVRNRVFQGLGVTVGTNSIVGSVLTFLIPAGWSVNLVTVVTVAAPTFAIIASTEIIL